MAKSIDKYGLNKKQRLFADKYLTSPDRNAKASYISIYKPKSEKAAASAANRLLKNVNVAAYIQQKDAKVLNALDISHERLLQEYARIGFFDPRKLFNDDGTLKAINELDDDTAAAISGLDVSTMFVGDVKDDTSLEIKKFKLVSKLGALDSLGKIIGSFSADNAQKNQNDENATNLNLTVLQMSAETSEWLTKLMGKNANKI